MMPMIDKIIECLKLYGGLTQYQIAAMTSISPKDVMIALLERSELFKTRAEGRIILYELR